MRQEFGASRVSNDRSIGGIEMDTCRAEKDESARRLAETRYEVDSGISEIFRIVADSEVEESADEPVKLLEVNHETIAAGIMPLHFGAIPERGIEFSSIIVDVTPEEFAKIRSHELKLPGGWNVGEPLPRPAGIDAE
jgi:hypothetical protein